MMVLTMAMVGEAVPKAEAGSAMGLLGMMSAIGTALGPTLGGVLIARFGWPAIFLINVPLGILTLLLAHNCLPHDRNEPKSGRVRFDAMGTFMFILTLAAYALAMTMSRDSFSLTSLILVLIAIVGASLFLLIESRAASPLIRLTMFRNPTLSAGFSMSILVTTVVMATLVVGPFYLAGALLLDAAQIGLVMSAGPVVAALAGAPAGRLADRFGAFRVSIAGLVGMLIGSTTLPLLPTGLGFPGYIAPLMFVTAGYALFQAANNTAVMTSSTAADRGVISGVLNLSRNLGLITGASMMGAVFAFGANTSNILTASPELVVAGMRITFVVAAGLIFVALAIAGAIKSHVGSPFSDEYHATISGYTKSESTGFAEQKKFGLPGFTDYPKEIHVPAGEYEVQVYCFWGLTNHRPKKTLVLQAGKTYIFQCEVPDGQALIHLNASSI